MKGSLHLFRPSAVIRAENAPLPPGFLTKALKFSQFPGLEPFSVEFSPGLQ
jgi:hypothetical protein